MELPENFWDDSDYDDDPYPSMSNECPICGQEYDEIDYEYQICRICKFDNSKKK